MKITAEQLAELAMEAEKENVIDWGLLAIDEKDAYTLMASSVIQIVENTPDNQKMFILMSAMTNLMVENMVLNARLMGAEV